MSSNRSASKRKSPSMLSLVSASHSQPSTSSEYKVIRPETLRVKRIPNDFEAETLKAEITKIFEAKTEIHSLEPSDDECLCATVTFPDKDPDYPSKALSTVVGGKYHLLYDTDFIGITPLFDAKFKAEVDVIAVHGLGTHAFGTFRSPVNSKMWLRDFLKDDFPNIRVLLYGYVSTVVKSNDTQSLRQMATMCLRNIVHFRKATRTEDRPIIFLGQSQGGFIIQELLIMAEDKCESPERNIFDKWYGLIGFGIPIHGLKNDGLRDNVEGRPNMRSIGQYSLDEYGQTPAYLDTLSQSFNKCHREKQVDILYYEETRTTEQRMMRLKLEPNELLSVRHSHSPLENARILFMPTDHSRMVKFKDINDPNYYENVRKEIKVMVDAAIEARKQQEPDIREFSACLKSLAFDVMDQRGNGIEDRTAGTCEWLMMNDTYKAWIAQRRGLLWIMGDPGTGKSTLMKYALASAVEKKLSQNKHVLASFFFHGRGVDLQKNRLGLFRSLLHQILVQVPEELSEFNSKFLKDCETKLKSGEVWVWQEKAVQNHLKECIMRVSSTHSVHLYIDALDEGGEGVARELVDFFQRMVSQNDNTEGGLSICFSCRYYPIVVPDQNPAIIHVERENRQDVATYIHDRLKRGIQDTLKAEELQKALVKKAENLFQWAVLVTDNVILLHDKGQNMKFIRKRINETPTKLNELYQNILASIEEAEKSQSLKLMQWICFALNPLSLAELRFAMAVDVDPPYSSLKDLYEESMEYSATDDDIKKRIKSLSGGLVEVREYRAESEFEFEFESVFESDSDSNSQSYEQGHISSQFVVQFIHQSVNDYLLKRGLEDLDVSKTSTVAGRAHYRLSRACLKYIALNEVLSSTKGSANVGVIHAYSADERALLSQEFPFLSYAVTNWVLHAELVEAERVSQEDLLRLLGGPQNRILRFLMYYNRSFKQTFWRSPLDGSTLLHIAAKHGFLSVFKALIESGKNFNKDLIDSKDAYDQTPLIWATKGGHEAIVQLLIEKGAKVNARGGRYNNALLAASAQGHKAIVQLLLEKGADINIQGGYYGNALSAASAQGHKAIVQLLLEKGADIDTQGGHYGNALLAASMRGHQAIEQLLLDKGADVNVQRGYHRNALSAASARGHEAIVQLLLERGAKLPVRRRTKKVAVSLK